MNQADLVEEQELKERIVEQVVRDYERICAMRDDMWPSGNNILLNHYMRVRDRNNVARIMEHEEYCRKFREVIRKNIGKVVLVK